MQQAEESTKKERQRERNVLRCPMSGQAENKPIGHRLPAGIETNIGFGFDPFRKRKQVKFMFVDSQVTGHPS